MTPLTYQENLAVELRYESWRSHVGPPVRSIGRQAEPKVASWLEQLQGEGALVILKRREVSMRWGDSTAWTVGFVIEPFTDDDGIKRYGPRPRVRGVHLHETRQQHARSELRAHVGGTTNAYYGRRVTSEHRVWAQAGAVFPVFGEDGPDPEAPNGWDQAAYDRLALSLI